MKRILILFLGLMLLLTGCAFGEEPDLSGMSLEELLELQSRIRAEMGSRQEDYDALITRALSMLKAAWQEELARYDNPGKAYYVDIRGVRVIRIKEDLPERETEVFGGIKYLIEFLYYDDYMSCPAGFTSGHNVGYLDYSGAFANTFAVDDEGNMVPKPSLIRSYASRTYEADYSLFIEEVIDFRDQYNQVIEFRQ